MLVVQRAQVKAEVEQLKKEKAELEKAVEQLRTIVHNNMAIGPQLAKEPQARSNRAYLYGHLRDPAVITRTTSESFEAREETVIVVNTYGEKFVARTCESRQKADHLMKVSRSCPCSLFRECRHENVAFVSPLFIQSTKKIVRVPKKVMTPLGSPLTKWLGTTRTRQWYSCNHSALQTVMVGIQRGLAQFHTMDWIHGDIKLENIIVTLQP